MIQNLARMNRVVCVELIVGICVPESFVFSSKDPTCCDLLRAFAHIAQQETTMLAQQCWVLLRAFARALRTFDFSTLIFFRTFYHCKMMS